MKLFSSANIDTSYRYPLLFPITERGVGKKECQIREEIYVLQKPTPLFWYIGVI